jgi:hypothetical protein
VPALLLIVPKYGAVGAGMVWIILNLGYFVIQVQVMHTRVLRGETRNWYMGVLVPVSVILAIGWAGKTLIPEVAGFAMLFFIGLLYILMTVGGALSSSRLRNLIRMMSLHVSDNDQTVGNGG